MTMFGKTKITGILCLGIFVATSFAALEARAQFPGKGDDPIQSLGTFKIKVDSGFWTMFENSPLAAKGFYDKKHHVLTSPTLYDPNTVIGRSDSIDAGSSDDTNGV